MEKTYSRHVGEKFNQDGSARLFPGSTVLCHVDPNSETMKLLLKFHEAILRQAWHTNYAMLPPSSLHMTVFDLVCDQVRVPAAWTSRVALDAPLEAVDEMVLERWPFAPPAPPIKVIYDVLNIGEYITIRLKPQDEASNQCIRDYRDALSRLFGIRHPNHTSYFFHITFAYGITSLDVKEVAAINRFVGEWAPVLQNGLNQIELIPPKLCFFADMTHFSPKRETAQQNLKK